MHYAMIMAGGAGTRLWPMSRRDRPKQLIPFLDGRSLLEIAVQRLEDIVAPQHRFICTGERFRGLIRERLPAFTDEQILGEPVGRDSVNAVGLTAAVLAKHDPEAIFAVFTADHLISPHDEFVRAIKTAYKLVEDDSTRFITFSIQPRYPATAFGYLHIGEPITGFDNAYMVRQFKEKPDLPTAERWVESGEYGWNSGMFVFAAAEVIKALKRFKPHTCEGLLRIADAWDTPQRRAVLEEVYPGLEKINVDYALMEPASIDGQFSVCAVAMNVSWRDIGSWSSYGETLDSQENNIRANVKGPHLASKEILAVSDDPDHTITTIGCENLIIVHTADATFVCHKDRDQDVRKLVEKLDETLR